MSPLPSLSLKTRRQQQLRTALEKSCPKAIALYGLGVAAKDMLVQLSDLPVVGLMDKDPANIGRFFYGRPVLGPAELVSLRVDTIIIAASDIYWQTIASRIAPLCQQLGITILLPDGNTPNPADSRPPIKLPERSELAARLARHDAISFDLFETLVVRAASHPDDTLHLAVARSGVPASALAARKEAEAVCTEKAGRFAYPLSRIYDEMRTARGIPADVAERLHHAEIAAEIELSVPRRPVLDILNQCRRDGTRIAIVTDTHLQRSTIESILARCNIGPVDLLLISNEEHASKADGNLFDILKARLDAHHILHIGDNPVSDELRAVEHGLDACRLMSPNDLLTHSTLMPLLSEVLTLSDGLLLGLVSRRLMENPFSAIAPDRRPTVDSFESLGYCFFGPALLAWLGWLIRRLQETPADHLLFLAREGYVLAPLYNRLREALGLQESLPSGTYFATSRRMACVSALRTSADVRELLRDNYSGSSEGLLRLRFGLTHPNARQDDHLTHADTAAAVLIENRMAEILANAKDEREAYLAYVIRLGIMEQDRIAVADLGVKGSIQHALQRMLERPLDGYYITGTFGEDNPFNMTENTACLFPPILNGRESDIYRHHILWESVLVAPEGMYVRASRDGSMHNAPPGMNQSRFREKAAIHAGIAALIEDWMALGHDPAAERINPGLVDRLFGQVANQDIVISEELKASFYVEERFSAETERKIWD